MLTKLGDRWPRVDYSLLSLSQVHRCVFKRTVWLTEQGFHRHLLEVQALVTGCQSRQPMDLAQQGLDSFQCRLLPQRR